MSFDFSSVSDNSLLPFAGANSFFIRRGDDNVSDEIDIFAIFENGFLTGEQTANSIRVSTNGNINLSGTFARLSPVSFDQDTRVTVPGVENSGILIDFNADRDSVVITWNAVPQFHENVQTPATYQIELRDRGEGDAEIIYRFVDLPPTYSGFALDQFFAVGGPFIRHPYSTADFRDLPNVEGNTGVTGVWQFRIEDGLRVEEDFDVEARTLLGTSGDDDLSGFFLDDRLSGLEGNDTLSGFNGQDTLMGNQGDDVIYGGAANDTLVGGEGNDLIDGGAQNDLIGAGAGDDTIVSSAGSDTIYAAAGADSVDGFGNFGTILAYGGDGDDSLQGGNERNDLYGDDGDDLLSGGRRDDRLFGGAGDDVLNGGADRDVLRGDEGADLLSGGRDDDQLQGGAGDDALNGGFGNDLLFGDDGDDFIFGALGRDTATGGAGADRFFVSRNDGDSLHITDYNFDEGDALVLDGTLFDVSELSLQRSTQQAINGGETTVNSLALVRLSDTGGLSQTLFSFDNADAIESIILRLPMPGEAGQVLTLDFL